MGPAMRIYKKRLNLKESILPSNFARLDDYSFSFQYTKRTVKGNSKKH